MKIRLITPASSDALNGNRMTAVRWARMLRSLGHRAILQQHYDGGACDLMIALHARRSFDSIWKFRRTHPDSPLIVALTGTDLYRDIRTSARAKRSLDLATRLVVLQSQGKTELPEPLRSKTSVIYQSARQTNGRDARIGGEFNVCVIGHLRAEKDPFRTALASRRLPASSRIRVLHIGRALTHGMAQRARAESGTNPRYRWFGELPHWKALQILTQSKLLALTSRIEGSSNVLSEALARSVPVIASRIPGLIGTLGDEYPGYFSVGDTVELASLLHRAECDPAFYRELKAHCARLVHLVDPERECASWRELLRELF